MFFIIVKSEIIATLKDFLGNFLFNIMVIFRNNVNRNRMTSISKVFNGINLSFCVSIFYINIEEG